MANPLTLPFQGGNNGFLRSEDGATLGKVNWKTARLLVPEALMPTIKALRHANLAWHPNAQHLLSDESLCVPNKHTHTHCLSLLLYTSKKGLMPTIKALRHANLAWHPNAQRLLSDEALCVPNTHTTLLYHDTRIDT